MPAPFLIAAGISVSALGGIASLLRRAFADGIGLVLLAVGLGAWWLGGWEVAGGVLVLVGSGLLVVARRGRAEGSASRERELRLIADNLPGFVARVDTSFRYTFANARFAEQFGVEADRIIGLEVRELIGERAAAVLRPFHERALAGEEVTTEQELVFGDGQVVWVSSRYVPERAPNGTIRGFYAMVNDITARKQAEIELKESREQLQAIISSASDLIFTLDEEGHVVFLNRAASNAVASASVGSALHDQRFMPAASGAKLREALRGVFERGEGTSFELEAYRSAGETTWYLCRLTAIVRQGKVTGATMVATDITAQREAERRLRQSQKLDAVGRLAEGVAHDFSNYLMAIRGHLELALLGLPEGDDARTSVVRAIQATEQATGVARSLLTFSSDNEPSKRPVNLGAAVSRTLELVGTMLPSTISVSLDLSDMAVWIEGDADQIGQVVMNLALNARDAMGEGGRLEVSVGTGVSEGRGVGVLQVRDTGTGLSSEARERIFDPYFTTKDRGEGTGLGLPIVHGIVRAHGGSIDLDSEPGRGTTIRILLPLIPAPREVSEVSGKRGTVLLVDDNDLVRGALSAQLRMLGFGVLEAADASTAIELFERNGESIVLFVVDQDLPGMTGVACLERMRSAGATGGAIIVTGSLSMPDDDLAVLDAHLLRKPFTLEALRKAVEACCSPRPAGANGTGAEVR